MKKLTKNQIAQHTKLSAELHLAHDELEGAITKYNEKVAAAFAELEPVVAALNAKIFDANTFTKEIHDEQQSFFDEKSEKWQEGDAGSTYTDWMNTWEVSDLEEVELDIPGELEMSEIDVETFDWLETECST